MGHAPFVISFVISLGRICILGAKGSLQRAATARTVDRKRTVHNLAMI